MTALNDKKANSPLKAWMRALEMTAGIERSGRILPQVIEDLAARFGDAPALIGRDAQLTYRELAAASARYSRWALSQGIGAGDVVCLLMPNSPHYLALWLGFTRIGASVALLNAHLTGEGLSHSIALVQPRLLIVAAELTQAIGGAKLPATTQCWAFGPGEHLLPRLDLEAVRHSPIGLSVPECAVPALADRALYIYTSGTTGLPKAAITTHQRIMQWAYWFAGMMDTRPDDRMYNCLPMYHSVGGVVATGATLVGGGAVIVRERFSASDFWRDLAAERCTLFQYIGELCRYLVAGPAHPDERRHQLRLACGNGLRRDVWPAFQDRFAIPQILEYYAATEGSFSLYNCEGRRGSIGRIPPFLTHRMPIALVRFDTESGLPMRDEAGRCIRCGPHETGEAIGQLHAANAKPIARFDGYTDAGASAQKVLEDVFAAGDSWYRTGDLMRQDEQGFYYFVDRIGDTFRWKGENVSTGEVTAVLTACPGVVDAAVYGVRVAHTDGRAGMAALVVAADFDLAQLHTRLAQALPDYARPLFVRLVGSIDLTGTFKLRKHELAVQGFDPTVISDALYCDDRATRAYVRLDRALYERICSGAVRL